jgi:hypothetical protein
MVEEEVLIWWKYGGVNVVEVENKKILKRNFSHLEKRVGFHFCFHHVFSTTFFHHVFPPRKNRRRRPIIIIIFFLYFLIKKRKTKFL